MPRLRFGYFYVIYKLCSFCFSRETEICRPFFSSLSPFREEEEEEEEEIIFPLFFSEEFAVVTVGRPLLLANLE